MSVQALTSSPAAHSAARPVQAPPPVQARAKDNDGDEATESAASKTREAAVASSPVNANLGNKVNTTV